MPFWMMGLISYIPILAVFSVKPLYEMFKAYCGKSVRRQKGLVKKFRRMLKSQYEEVPNLKNGPDSMEERIKAGTDRPEVLGKNVYVRSKKKF